jgi:hypothetical protein
LRDVSLDEDTCCIAYPEATLILSKFFFLTRHHIWYLMKGFPFKPPIRKPTL